MSKTFTTRFIDTLSLRNAEKPSADTESAIKYATHAAASINAAMSRPEFKELATQILKGARIADSATDKGAFIAVKVLVKMVRALDAIGAGSARELDGYTRCIVGNLINLHSKGAGMSNKSNLVALSSAITFDETEQVTALKHRYNCKASTATTQASSTRMLMHYMGICNVAKGARGDVMTFNETDRAQVFASLFGAFDLREATEAHTE